MLSVYFQHFMNIEREAGKKMAEITDGQVRRRKGGD